MTKFFKPLVSFFRLFRTTGSFRVAYNILPANFTPHIKSKVSQKNKVFRFPSYGKSFTGEQLKLFGVHGELLQKFIKATNISFSTPTEWGNTVAISLNKEIIRLITRGYDNLKVVEEIFIDQVYDFKSQGKYVVCDVGMNVGAASLYFASFENVVKVFGYEPFPLTFQEAKRNLLLNQQLSQKIEIFNYGLGRNEESVNVPVSDSGFLGGTTSLFMIKETDQKKAETISVDIKTISSVINKIKLDHPQCKIILKLDCEGAEYDIISKLSEDNMLQDIFVFMIEYHFLGKSQLREKLLAAGFYVMSPGSEDVTPFGMLYAFKNADAN